MKSFLSTNLLEFFIFFHSWTIFWSISEILSYLPPCLDLVRDEGQLSSKPYKTPYVSFFYRAWKTSAVKEIYFLFLLENQFGQRNLFPVPTWKPVWPKKSISCSCSWIKYLENSKFLARKIFLEKIDYVWRKKIVKTKKTW